MNIGIAGPLSLDVLRDAFEGINLPETFAFPPLAHYARECLRRGVAVHIFTLGYVSATQTFEAERLKVTVVPWRRQHRMVDFYRVERNGLARAMAASACDVIHANWTYEFALAAQASGKPYLITARDAPFIILKYMRPLRYWFAKALLSIPVIFRAPELVVASPYLAKYFRSYHLFRRPIHLIPSFVSDSSFDRYSGDLGEAWKLESPTYISIANGWNSRKNVDSLIHAFSFVREKLPSARLLLFGAGYGLDEPAQAWARSKCLEAGIEFRGHIDNDQLKTILAKEGNILVHPSREESFGVAIADAMAMGIPVVAGANSGAVPWLLDQGRSGVLVDINNPRDIADGMVGLAINSEDYRTYRLQARTRAESLFRLEAVTQRYLEIFAKILNQQKPQAT